MNNLYRDHIAIQRRHTDAALAATGFEALAIFAGAWHMPFLDDQPYPFKVNPHFKLWTPLAEAADCWIVYRPADPIKLVFAQPNDYWYKPLAIPSDFWVSHFQIEVIREAKQARDHILGIPRCAFIGEWQSQFDEWGFADRNPERLLHHLHYPRARKTDYEVECMRRASSIAARAHRAAEAAFRHGASEHEINMAYVLTSGQTENELPYPNIVALNGNTAVLHYQNKERTRPDTARSFLIDAGAQFNGYAADVTRTYSRRRDEFAALIDKMDTLQRGLCTQVRPGVDFLQIQLDAYLRIGNLLKELDLITISGADAAETGLTSVFFPHGVGHLLGLQVHDIAGFSVTPDGRQKAPPQRHPYLRLTRTLGPGFVVTIEPGVYFIDALLNQAGATEHAKHINWRQVGILKPYGGVRVEDNVACTAGEAENLTRAAFAACA